jgi:hypothetical protein
MTLVTLLSVLRAPKRELGSISPTLFLRTFFVQMSFLAAFFRYVLALAQKFVQINVIINVDEIDTWGQFHQHVYTKLLYTQIPKAQIGSVFALKGSTLVKASRKMLVKSTPGLVGSFKLSC